MHKKAPAGRAGGITEPDRITCFWHEDSNAGLAPALRQLQHCGQVTKAALSTLGDLTIRFANGRSPQIWNDTPFEVGSECWSISYQGRGYYAVQSRNRLVYEEKK